MNKEAGKSSEEQSYMSDAQCIVPVQEVEFIPWLTH